MSIRFLLLLLCCTMAGLLSAQTVGTGWQQLPGPTGGDVLHLSRGPDNTLWAGTSAGLYTRPDTAWRKLAHTPFGQTAVRRVWPVADGQLLVLADRRVYLGSEATSWQTVLDSLDGLEASGQQVWAWQRSGRLYRSTGDPTRWEAFDAPAPLASLAFDGRGQVWLAAADSLRLWTGQPTAWTDASTGLTPVETRETAAAWATSTDTLYVATTRGQVFARSGNRWELRTEADPWMGGLSALLAVGGRLFSGSARGTLRHSDDGGRSWRAVLSLPSADSLYCLLAVGEQVLAGSYRSGVLLYTESQPPAQLNAGLTAATAEHIAWLGQRLIVAAVRDVGLFRSRDGGQTWAPASAGLGFTQQLDLLSADGRLWVAGLGLERVYESRDSATSWRGIGAGLPDFGASCLLWRPSDRRLLAGTPRQGVHVWNGLDWRPLPQLGLPPNPSIRRLALDAAGQVVAALSGQGVFRYADDLERWEPMTAGLPAGLVQGLWRVGDSLLAAAGHRLLVWRGSRWVELRRFVDAAGQPVLVAGLAADTAGRFVVGTQGSGCWLARPDSAAGWLWDAFSEGLFNGQVLDVQTNGAGQLLATTAGTGLFRWQATTDPDSVVGRRPGRPVAASLRIYPNPAKEALYLTYEMIDGQPLSSLQVFDPEGKKILDQKLDRAADTLTIGTENWPAGLYLFRLQTDGGSLHVRQKVMLVR